MRWFLSICAALLLCATMCVADPMPPYSKVKADMDKAVYQQMSEKGIVANGNVNWLAGRIRKAGMMSGNVYVVYGNSIWISPSDIYLGVEVVNSASNGALTGLILCAAYVIENGGMEKRYDDVARTVNSFANASKNDPNSAANTRLLQGIAFQISDIINRDILFQADASACSSLFELGYPATDYIDFLKSMNTAGTSGVAKIFFSLSDRIAKLDKSGPWPTPTEPAPKSPQSEIDSEFQKKLKNTDRFTEIDPTPFLSALEGKTVEGYCYDKLTPNIYLLFNRSGKVVKPKPASPVAMLLDESKMTRDERNTYYLDDGKKNKATEAVFLVINPRKDKTFFMFACVGTEVGTANMPEEYRDVTKRDFSEAHGNWPYKDYLALRMKVDDLKKGENRLQIVICVFRKSGDETGQYTSRDSLLRPTYGKFTYSLLR